MKHLTNISAGTVVGLLLVAVASLAGAQPIATSDKAFSFAYSDADVAAGGPVTRFELRIDTGTYAPHGLQAVPGQSEQYWIAIPPSGTGVHTASFRACNDDDLCGGALDFTYRLGVVPAVIRGDVTIIDTPN